MRTLIFLLLLLPLAFACRKDEDPDANLDFCELNPEECVDIRKVKDWFYFNFGSYWV
ncbi:MAG: hypothetical protein GQ574_06650, partial [Crocinitomix sp.]|nr:hypothetical protein [Crocinitomix sp.]